MVRFLSPQSFSFNFFQGQGPQSQALPIVLLTLLWPHITDLSDHGPVLAPSFTKHIAIGLVREV